MRIPKLTIMSRETMLGTIENGFPENTAVISFSDPPGKRRGTGAEPIDYSGICDRVFAVRVHDADPSYLPELGISIEEYFPEATELARFILKAASDGFGIICQCEYGQSRSAACAAAIREYFEGKGIEIFADYRYYPNQMIFNKLLAALREAGGGVQ